MKSHHHPWHMDYDKQWDECEKSFAA